MPGKAGSKRDVRTTAERILAIRDHGREELKRKLLSRGFEELEVETLIEKLVRAGLIDDDAYSEEISRYELERGHGLHYIRAKLKRKGIECVPSSLKVSDEIESLVRYMKRKEISRASLKRGSGREKIIRALKARGFTSAALAAVCNLRETEDAAFDRMFNEDEGDLP